MLSCLVIDNGSGIIKAGWAQETYPKLVFHSLVSKSTKCKANQQPGCFVGIHNSLSKTPFEEGLLVNADLMVPTTEYFSLLFIYY
ncbi:hypothetical protein HMI54_009352 [Coelomomyces lativittatus]|nr:hypothetical protein HMI54_009352 [Coelomomyces lativittatus]